MTRYAADLPVPGLLHARLVLALDVHAELTGIDAAEARAVPDVVAVLTAADLPIAPSAEGRSAEPLARAEVVYAGQPVALVVATSEAAAEDGAERVVVDTEPLPAVLHLESAPAVEEHFFRTGDAAAALAASDAVVRARFETSAMYQGYLEPQAATAWLDPDGDLVLSCATQAAFDTRSLVARALGLPHRRVRVRPTVLGGGFGGKQGVIEPLVAAAALRLRRPVRLVMTRSEDFAATQPAPAELVDLELGARADGTLTGARGRVVADRGAISDEGFEGLTAILALGPYRWTAYDLTATGVRTNRVGCGAYRAPGGPPATFAVESLIDELAGRLGIDPLDLRARNLLREADPTAFGWPCPRIGAAECLERVRADPLYARRHLLPAHEGVGVALALWPGGIEPAAAVCRLDPDGGLTVITGAVDMSGTDTTFALIAAEAFGVGVERVHVVAADTASAPRAAASGGSKVLYTVGRAVHDAALEARERLLEAAAAELEIAAEDLELADGELRPRGDPARAVGLGDVARRISRYASPHPPVEGHGRIAPVSRAPSAAAHLVHVRVDPETGRVDVLDVLCAQDAGRALNPALVEGQMQGGTVQGLGWALLEQLAHDEAGQPLTGDFLRYPIPDAGSVPPVRTAIVEVPASDGPFGAKGVGEASVLGAPAAVAGAVAAATGRRMRRLPMTPLRVWEALQPRP